MVSISVVVPCRNDADMLAVCLRALAGQTRRADEIIVVDNGSTDATALVAVDAGARVIHEPVQGIARATAAGFDAASGDILARLDADSIPPADWLERIERALATAGGLAAVTGPGDFYGSSRLVAWLGRTLYIGGYFAFVGLLLGHPPLFGSNLALDAAVWGRVRHLVHTTTRQVHDDLDLSYQLRPDMTVIYDPRLRVAISARPFDSWKALGRRLGWSYTTFRLDFEQEPPLKRRAERRRWARARATDSARSN
ncbi:glycosyltransferase family 2 protein [Parafrigoribacterium soli]|uniref:glycosyltransferase family 2 protein n=1 Tax=Parafrigoribacterium soli TaxID=3144663 RepID=UPI0032EAF3CE